MLKVFIRCERQTFCKLPHTEAVLFFIRTCVYPLSDIKDEGLGEQLANAIDGLRLGNNPEIFDYKEGKAWAEPVKAFLRGSSEC
jgi:hypothetical protein